MEDQDDGDEIKRKMALEGPKIKKELDRPGKLMVSGIPKTGEYTEDDLKREFSVFGPLLEVNIIRKKNTGIAKGFAFVTFKNPPDAEEASKALEGKDIGGDNPIHCERAVIGFIKQSQIASSRKRFEVGERGGRGRGGGRGGPMMDRGRGFRGMRGGPPSRGGRGRGGGGYGEGDVEGMYYNEEEEYYGGGDYWEGDGYGGDYPPRGRGRATGGPPQRGMRGGPPGMRGRGGPPGARGGYPGRGLSASTIRGGFSGRGGPMSERGGRPFRKTLLPNPPDMRGGRGGGRGYPPHASEEYYAEEEAGGYGEEYGGGAEEYYEEDPYNGAAYAEEEQYGGAVDEGYYGIPEPQPRHNPASRGRGGMRAPRGGRGGPSGPQSYGSEQPSRGRPQAVGGSGPYSRGAGGGGQMRGGGAPGRGGVPVRPMPSEPVRRQAAQDPYGYMEEPAAPRQRAAPPQSTRYDDYYGEEDMGSMHAAKDPYASARPPAGRSQAPPAARSAPPRRQADPYTEEQYGMYEGGDASTGYGDDYASSYPGSAPARRGAVLSSGGRPAEKRGYVDISEYIGLGAGSGSRLRNEYQGQGALQDMEREPRRSAQASRREDPYLERRVAVETDVYESYPSSARDPMPRKRPLDGYESSGAYHAYEEYRGAAATPIKRDRVDRSGYDAYSSRQEGNYRRL